jgi:NodT family efflux transporter outer membrane factor (OMF) lipoprotein
MATKASSASRSDALKLWTIAFLLPLSGCAVGPDYRAPDTPMPAKFAEAPAGSPKSVDADAITEWWKSFGDSQLDDLVARALAVNPDMEIAASRVRAARQEEIVAGASYWPRVNAGGTAERTRLSTNEMAGGLSLLEPSSGGNATGPGIAALAPPRNTFNLFQVGFDATWQLDFFGRTRRSVEAAKASTTAQIWGLRDTEVSLAAEVAGTYLGMRFNDERARLARSDLTRLQETLRLLDVRASGGLTNQLDVRQQETEVAATAAKIPLFEAQARAQAHALAVLLGQSPEEFRLTLPDSAIPPAPRDVPVGLPSTLLRRRPDIRQAERALASATAKIGIAVADLYPQFSLTASPSLASTTLRTLASLDSGGYSLGASLLWPIFNAGQTRANIDIANENQRQALTIYRKTVLTALKEVDDALSNFAQTQQRLTSLEQSAASAESAERLAREQYQGGLVDFSRVLSAEGMHLSADDDLLQGRAAVAQDWVALYKALGGGWRDQDLTQSAQTSPSPVPGE